MPVARGTLAKRRHWRTGGVRATVGSAQARGPRRVFGLSERRLAREWPLRSTFGFWRAFIVGLRAEAGCTSRRLPKLAIDESCAPKANYPLGAWAQAITIKLSDGFHDRRYQILAMLEAGVAPWSTYHQS
jgi:hypothetical protein